MRSGSRARVDDAPLEERALRIQFVDATRDPSSVSESLAGRRVLATVHYGEATRAPSDTPWEGALRVDVPLRQLGPSRAYELWSIETDPTRSRIGAVTLAEGPHVAFGSLDFEAEARWPQGRRFEESVRAGYRAMLEVLEARGLHPVRIWCTIPRIHELESGLERYQAFCRARARALDEGLGTGFEEALCASTAVGSDAGHGQLHFLATSVAGAHVENPRQVSAYQYPERYGPRSPSFARATRAPERAGSGLFVSGTASIVGSESLHAGDLSRQLDETIENLNLVTSKGYADDPTPRPRLTALKVYLRHAEDYAALASRLAEHWDLSTEVMILRADICREELLVEIEGVGSRAREHAVRS